MKNTKPYISIIIPAYNRADYISEALDSVLEQKQTRWAYEVIVVDDGSTDHTDEVMAAYKGRVRYYKIPHSGLPAVPRNFGISKAKGELIAFQDSDDKWVLDKLARQVPLFKDPAVVMSHGLAEKIDGVGTRSGELLVAPKKLKRGESFNTLAKENVISTLTVMVRKSTLQELGGFNESLELKAVEDYELWLRIAAKHPDGIKSIAKTLALYRQHDKNISHADPVLALERLQAVYDTVWESELLNIEQKYALESQIEIVQRGWGEEKEAMGEKPLISVVMGIYNAERFLRPAIKSILSQTFGDFEFIIIDDGCSDKSVKIVRSFKDDRIRLVHQTNHGLVAVLNKGVRIARGNFIARMDADDISLPSRLEKEVRWISINERRGLVGTFFTYIDEKNSTPSLTITSPTKHDDLVRMMYIVNPFAHGSTLIRKQAIIDAGGYRDTYGPTEDYDLWRRIAPHWEIGQIPESLYWYRLNPKSISHSKRKIQHKFAAKIVKEQWKNLIMGKSSRAIVRDARYYQKLDSPFAEKIYQQYIDMQARLAFEFLVRGRLRTGYRTALAAIWLNPRYLKSLWKTLVWAVPKRILERGKA